MNKHVQLFAFLTAFAAIMGSCRADIDLQDIDTRSELELGLAMPIGSMRATVGDFLGNGQVSGIYVGDNQVLYFRDTFNVTRTYHDVNLKEKVTNVTKHFNVYEELERQGKLEANGKVKDSEVGKQIKLEFPFTMQLNKINDDVSDERLDSALITNASFTSTIGKTNLPLNEKWVDKVEIVLGDEFKRKEKSIIVCKKGEFGYDKSIPLSVDQFVLNLMKRTTGLAWNEYDSNVKKECNLQINFYFTIPGGTTVNIPKTASYDYQLRVQFIKFEALWGYFKPSSDMRDADTVNIEDEWPKWHDLAKARLPFYDPSVKLSIKTTIAGDMIMYGDYIYAKSKRTNDSVYAEFGSQRVHERIVDVKTDPEIGYYMDLDSKIGDSITYKYITFDKTDGKGRIDRLFAIRPDILGYKFHMGFNQQYTPQIRVLPSSDIKIFADLYAPFVFNKGLEASYIDTLTDINLSKLSLDSLSTSVEMIDTIKTAALKLVLAFENKLPVRVRGKVRFMDENGKEIMDPKDKTKPLRIAQQDTLLIAAPEVKFEQGRSYIGEPGRSVFTVEMDKEHWDTFTAIKQMEFYAELDAEDMNPAYDKDPEYHVQITAEDNLKVNIGVTAQTDAVFKFASNESEK